MLLAFDSPCKNSMSFTTGRCYSRCWETYAYKLNINKVIMIFSRLVFIWIKKTICSASTLQMLRWVWVFLKILQKSIATMKTKTELLSSYEERGNQKSSNFSVAKVLARNYSMVIRCMPHRKYYTFTLYFHVLHLTFLNNEKVIYYCSNPSIKLI